VELHSSEIKNLKLQWLNSCKTGALSGKPDSKRTLEIKDYYFDYYLKQCKKLGITKYFFEVRAVRQVIASIPVKSYSTKQKIYDAIMSFTKFLVQEDLVKKSHREALRELKPKRAFPAKRSIVRGDGLQRLKDTLWNSSRSIYNKYLLNLVIELASGAGLRRAEIVNLRTQDFDIERAEIFVYLGKGNKNRRLGAKESVLESGKQYLWLRPQSSSEQLLLLEDGSPMTIKYLAQAFKRLADAASIEASLHGLRRYFVTSSVEAGHSLSTLQIACGHSSATTTALYCMPDEKRVIELMKNF
jgi:integrase